MDGGINYLTHHLSKTKTRVKNTPLRVAQKFLMQSHGCPIKTPKERQMALDDYKRIQKTSRRKGLDSLREKEPSSYAAISRDRLPKPGSGFKPLSSGLETNRRKH